MDFATLIQTSSSARNALSRFKRERCNPANLPTSNQLDSKNLNSQEKAFKRLASSILRLASANWWANAEVTDEFPEVIGFLKQCKAKGIKISILSSPFQEESVKGKQEWCSWNLPKALFSDIHIRSDKEMLASPNSMLLDDREKYCERFTKAGGHSVLFNSLWKAEMLSVLSNNNINEIFVDLDGVLVNTHKHLVQIMKSL
jgi:hypothetical protein